MSKLDEISASIGELRSEVRTLGREMAHVKTKVEAINKARYQAQGAAWMLRTLWGVGAAALGVVGGTVGTWLSRKAGI